ncbi:MAG: ImmA/IrrE family metallo-endopeptidase [Lachnospiraceae bacterium]|nr:ImmA/IrrE family metallo-endopeptidase [Lachnospiraceae bacterium]
MDALTKRYINDLAQRILSVYQITIPITNIEDIVRRMGGYIEEKYGFDDLCDGTIRKVEADHFCIAISPFQNEQRKAFTIAHELGHLFLHMGYGTDRKLWEEQDETVYRRFGTSNQEYQANEFAAAFLMPIDVYKQKLEEYSVGDKVDISKVADYFNVSISAASNRGKFLGYLVW